MTEYLYHFRRKSMQGHILYPLNQLKEHLPQVYEAQIAKYKGREWVLERRIPVLDCLWNDVLHLSPIHPQLILDAMRAHGLYEYAEGAQMRGEAYRVPAECISNETAVCFQSGNFDISNFDPALERFWPFESAKFREQRAEGRRLFWYSHTTHILAKQEIDVSGCDVVSFE